MNTLKLKLFVGTLAIAFLLPSTTNAYFTTKQTATRLSPETTLFTITYKFGFESREVFMPIGAMRDNSTSTSPYLEYALFDGEDSEVSVGKSAGFVFSTSKDVEIRDNQYYLAPGKSAEFTLMTLVTTPLVEQPKDVYLEVTSLPFKMISDGAPIPAKLNPSELQYYRTPTISSLIKEVVVTEVRYTQVSK